MKTTELLAAVMNADESTRKAIRYVLNLVDDNQTNEPFSLRFVKTELPRQGGKTSLAVGNALMRAGRGERVCLMLQNHRIAYDVMGEMREILNNPNVRVGCFTSVGRGHIDIECPTYKNLLGKYFDTIIFDESFNLFKEKVQSETELEEMAVMATFMKNGGTLIRLETKNEGNSRNR